MATTCYGEDQLLAMLKVDLGYKNPDPDTEEFMRGCLKSAEAELSGIVSNLDTIPETKADITVMLAAWRYRHRDATENTLPSMIRYAINNAKVRTATR